MKRFQPSRTAEYMAFFRALESARPASQRLFHDPFATYFVRPYLRRAARASHSRWVAAFVNWYADLRIPGARTSAIARTKLIDDALLAALRNGISQVVILGSGFDCRAYRLPELASATVFEVDHPATLATKLERLRRALPEAPRNVRYVEVDFLRQTLPEVLIRAGFRPAIPTAFVWEGVSHYLTADAVDSVLQFVAQCATGTRVIFSYVHSSMLDGSVPFDSAPRLLRDFKRLGEPWIFGLHPESVAEFLQQRGLFLDRDLGASAYRRLYFGRGAERMRGYEFYHVAMAHT